MAVIGAGGTQLVYVAAIQRIPVNTAILIEYMAPLLLVGFVWARTRRLPRPVVFIGSAVAVVGLILVVSPGGAASFDVLGLVFAAIAAVGCAIYYVVAAAPSDGLPPIALASFGLLGGGIFVGLSGLVGVVPFTANLGGVAVLGSLIPLWLLLLAIGAIATAIPYATSITATEILGSRLASCVGLLEVVAAALYAWLLLGENLTVLQILGGVLILVGIGFVRSERAEDLNPALEPGTEPSSGTGTGTGPGPAPGAGVGMGAGTDTGNGPGPGPGAGTGTEPGQNSVTAATQPR
jgi:drug/metabolite transporter (DMT)-like permease